MINFDFDHGQDFAIIYLLTIAVVSSLIILLANNLPVGILKKSWQRLTEAIFYGIILIAFLSFLIIVGPQC